MDRGTLNEESVNSTSAIAPDTEEIQMASVDPHGDFVLNNCEERKLLQSNIEVFLTFESFPLWLLALSPLNCAHVYLATWNKIEDIVLDDTRKQLVLETLNRLGEKRVTFLGSFKNM